MNALFYVVVDGVWGEWNAWSCLVTCGDGTRFRSRTCLGIQFGGATCVDLVRPGVGDVDVSSCNAGACGSAYCLTYTHYCTAEIDYTCPLFPTFWTQTMDMM
jgi:hypothetical protein